MAQVAIEITSAVATLWLDRPDRHNAFDDVLMRELIAALDSLKGNPSVRCLILAGRGKNFSAGADLGWMRRMAGASEAENEADAGLLADLMHRLGSLSKPTIAAVHGAALGGGVGLVAACDMALAAEDAVFSLSEVRLGLIPSVISPYVIAAIGPRAARRYFLTAERFDAATAARLGLVGAVLPADQLLTEAARLAALLAANPPRAMAEAKLLIEDVTGRPIDQTLRKETARRIARLRAGEEAREGIAAFLEKRKPRWQT